MTYDNLVATIDDALTDALDYGVGLEFEDGPELAKIIADRVAAAKAIGEIEGGSK